MKKHHITFSSILEPKLGRAVMTTPSILVIVVMLLLTLSFSLAISGWRHGRLFYDMVIFIVLLVMLVGYD